MTSRQRDAIRGVHYGGMSIAPAAVNDFREAFPNAVHLAGYGNTLFGVVMEVADRPREAMDYFPLADRVRFHVVEWREDQNAWPPRPVGHGGQRPSGVPPARRELSARGRGGARRGDARRPFRRGAHAFGGRADGLRNPGPPAARRREVAVGPLLKERIVMTQGRELTIAYTPDSDDAFYYCRAWKSDASAARLRRLRFRREP